MFMTTENNKEVIIIIISRIVIISFIYVTVNKCPYDAVVLVL